MWRLSASMKKTLDNDSKGNSRSWNTLEAEIDKLQEILHKEIEDLKIKQAEIQNTITDIKKHH